jgi:hypothetical protein
MNVAVAGRNVIPDVAAPAVTSATARFPDPRHAAAWTNPARGYLPRHQEGKAMR